MSCIASEVGTPVLLLSSCSSFEKERHSGPDSSNLSVMTKPQLPQNVSPVLLSVTKRPFPHLGHLSVWFSASLTNLVIQKLFLISLWNALMLQIYYVLR